MKRRKYPEALIASMQLLIVAILLLTLLVPLVGKSFGVALGVMFGLTFIFILVVLTPREFKEDYLPVGIFFGVIFALVELAWLTALYIPTTSERNNIFILILFVMIFFIILFKLLFSRDYTYGTVLVSDSEHAAVEVKFDIRTGMPGGIYIVETPKKLKKGSRVKVRIEKHFFGKEAVAVI
jgi:uncharacterized membrane protein